MSNSFGRRDISKVLSGALPSIPLTSQTPAGPRYNVSGSESFESPRLSGGYQLVPSGGMAPFDINSVEERLRQLEVRMTIAERSGRTAWEETMRTQTELRRAVDHVIKRDSGNSAIDSATDSLLASRLNAHLQSYSDGRTIIASQLSDLKQKQQQLNARLEQALTLIEDSNRSSDQIQRASNRLSTELQTLRGRVESQNNQLVDFSLEIKNNSQKFEQESRRVAETLQYNNELQTDQTISQLKIQLDKRLTEMRDLVASLRDQLDKQGHELKSLEHSSTSRNNEMKSTLTDEQRRLSELIKRLESKVLEQDKSISSQYSRLQKHLADSLSDTVLKTSDTETQLRRELATRMDLVATMFQAEEQARAKLEKSTMNQGNESKESVKKILEDDLRRIQQEYTRDLKKTKETMKTLNDAVELVDKSLQEQKKQQDKLLAAEIKSRQQQESSMSQRIIALEQQLTTVQISTEQKIEDRLLQADEARASAIKEQIADLYVKYEALRQSNAQPANTDDRLIDIIARVEALEQLKNDANNNESTKLSAVVVEEAPEEETTNEEEEEEPEENENEENDESENAEQEENTEEDGNEEGAEEEAEVAGEVNNENEEEETNEPPDEPDEAAEPDETEDAENEDGEENAEPEPEEENEENTEEQEEEAE